VTGGNAREAAARVSIMTPEEKKAWRVVQKRWLAARRLLDRLTDLMEFLPGPESWREEVAPMIDSPQRDCRTARLAAAFS